MDTSKKNGNRYFTFASTDKNKDVLTKYTELCDKIKSLIEKINDTPGEFGKYFMKIKFYSDDNFPLNKILKLGKVDVSEKGKEKEN